MNEEDKMSVFPDITPDMITEKQFYSIKEFDTKTEDEFQDLIHLMFDYPDRDFYYFQQKDGVGNQLIIGLTQLNSYLIKIKNEFAKSNRR
jgi:hypothetical protein